MPQLQRLWDELKDKGLHVFHAEVQNTPEDQLQEFVHKKGMTFPQVRGTVPGYEGGRGIPYSFVIGVDGTVIWQGGGGGYKSIIHEEIKKVRYPGLGKVKVAKGLESSAAKFATKSYAKAIAGAEKQLAKAEEKGDTAVVEDAKYIIERANLIGEKMNARVERLKGEREYALALASLQQLSQSFKGLPLGEESKMAFKALKKDPQVKKELKAEAAFEGIKKKIATINDPQDRVDLLNAFADKYDGMKAAERARNMAKWL